MLASRAACLLLIGSSAFMGACGGKTVDGIDSGNEDVAQPTPTTSSTGNPPPNTPYDAGGRTCLPNCTVGHECCTGGCGGIPAAMPSSCCSCLPGEVGSETCTSGKCGG